MNYAARRQAVYDQLEDNSLLILYSGAPAHISVDAYHEFQANRHFFYLTGLRRENMILFIRKAGENSRTTLYIEKADPLAERWTGKMVTVEEAREVSGIQDIRFVDRFETELT